MMSVDLHPSIHDVLRRPYTRTIVPQTDGTFHAEIVEFPGCIATGGSSEEAARELEEVAASWLEACFAEGIEVPAPREAQDYSGKFLVRVAKSVHCRASQAAELEGISLNQFVASCLAETLGRRSVAAHLPVAHNVFNQLNLNHFSYSTAETVRPRLVSYSTWNTADAGN